MLPEGVGDLRLEDGTALQTLWLTSSEGEPTLHAALVTLEDLTPEEPLPNLTWATNTVQP